MSKLKKIKWLMFMLENDGVPPKTLTDDMDIIDLYCTMVLLARIYVYIRHTRIPFELALSLTITRNKYAHSKRGIEKRRLKKLHDAYNAFLFKWELENPDVSNIY